MDQHDAILPLLADYATGVLSQADRQRVRAHLASCPACAGEARDFTEAFQSIALENDPVRPPPQLRIKMLERLARAQRGEDVTAHVIAVEPTRDRSWFTSPAALALAATLVLVLGGLLALSLQRTERLEDALRGADETNARLASRAAETSVQADLAVSILTATDMRRIDLAGLDSSRNATARGYWSASRGLLIVADRLPALPSGQIYQVWLIGSSSEGPVSAGLIDGQTSGRGMLIVPAPRGVRGDSVTIAVTDEPAGGLPAPTGAKHLLGSL